MISSPLVLILRKVRSFVGSKSRTRLFAFDANKDMYLAYSSPTIYCLFTLSFIVLESCPHDPAIVVNNYYTFDGSFYSVYGLFNDFSHLSISYIY